MITLKTLSQATAQQVFNQVKQHMLTQGERCLDGQGNCLYRFEKEGKVLKCAAGCFIGDDEYIERMDNSILGSSWHDLVEEDVVPGAHRELINKLQFIHDSCTPSMWEEELMTLAIKEDLIW